MNGPAAPCATYGCTLPADHTGHCLIDVFTVEVEPADPDGAA